MQLYHQALSVIVRKETLDLTAQAFRQRLAQFCRVLADVSNFQRLVATDEVDLGSSRLLDFVKAC